MSRPTKLKVIVAETMRDCQEIARYHGLRRGKGVLLVPLSGKPYAALMARRLEDLEPVHPPDRRALAIIMDSCCGYPRGYSWWRYQTGKLKNMDQRDAPDPQDTAAWPQRFGLR